MMSKKIVILESRLYSSKRTHYINVQWNNRRLIGRNNNMWKYWQNQSPVGTSKVAKDTAIWVVNKATQSNYTPAPDHSISKRYAERDMIYEATQRETVPGRREGWIDMHKRDSNESKATLQLPHTTLRSLWVEREEGWKEWMRKDKVG